MAFTKQGLQVNRGNTTAHTQGSGVSVEHSYLSSDTIAVITAPGYFPPNFVSPDSGSPNIAPQSLADSIKINDTLFIRGSNGAVLVLIESLDPVTLGSDLFGASGALEVDVPIAPTDNNGLVFNGTALQTEFADATHNGILSTAAQSIAGEKTLLGGIKTNSLKPGISGNFISFNTTPDFRFESPNVIFSSNSGDFANLTIVANVIPGSIQFSGGGVMTTYRDSQGTVTWGGPWGATTLNSVMRLQRLNDVVRITVNAVTPTVATVATIITISAPIPVGFAPSANRTGILRILNNGNGGVGTVTVNASGIVTIAADVDNSNFMNAGLAAFFDFSFDYNI